MDRQENGRDGVNTSKRRRGKKGKRGQSGRLREDCGRGANKMKGGR